MVKLEEDDPRSVGPVQRWLESEFSKPLLHLLRMNSFHFNGTSLLIDVGVGHNL